MHLQYAIDEFLNSLQSEITRRNYKVALDDFSDGKTYLMQVTKESLLKYKESLMKRTGSAQTITARLAAIRSFCDFVWLKGWMDDNPGFQVKPERVIKYGNAKNISLQEFEELLRNIDIDSLEGIRDFLLLRLLYFTGNKDLVINLKWNQELPANLGQYKNIYKEKIGKKRTIDFKRGYLFFILTNKPKNDKPISLQTIRRILASRTEKAGLDPKSIDIEALKRLRARQIYEKTNSEEAVQKFCGHKSIKVTQEFIKSLCVS